VFIVSRSETMNFAQDDKLLTISKSESLYNNASERVDPRPAPLRRFRYTR